MKKLRLKNDGHCSMRCNWLCSTIITLAVVLPLNAVAQFGVAIGPKAGVSVTKFKDDGIQHVETLASWLGGAFINAQITPSITIQPEILFTKRGGDFTHDEVRTSIAVNYFEVPVVAKFRLPIRDIIFPHLLLGPNFAFRTNLRYTSTDTETGTAISTNDTDIKNSDIGALVGAGIDVQTNNSGIFFTLDGRYGFGFNNINRRGNAVELRNRGWSFSFGVGYIFTR